MELIVRSLAEQNDVTEQLKAENQMEWVRQMNACKAQADEIVKAELIYDWVRKSGQKTVRTFLIYSKVAVELFMDFMIWFEYENWATNQDLKGDWQMKKVIAAMAAMFIAVVLLGGLWGILLKPIMGGGGADLSFIYPIYIGLILLAGLIVGAAVVLYEEIKKLQEEIKNISEKTTEEKQE